MADLKLEKGDRVLVEMIVARPTPDKDGDIHGHVEGNDVWLPPDKIYSKLYTPIEEPVELGSRVADDDGNTYTRFTNQGDTPWVSESGGFWMWEEIFHPRVLD